MKNLFTLIMISALTAWSISSCSKKDSTTEPSHTKALYAAGYYTKSGKAYTTLWKDGAAAVFDSSASLYDVFLNGSDLYVAGQKNSKAVIWKNSAITQLPTDPSYGYVIASSIYIAGSDVHIAGMAENATTFRKQAIYWKNNVPVMLNAGANTEDSYAQSVFVSGTDVYVVGRKTILGGGEAVVLWKNGTATDLVSNATISYGNVKLFISGNDVYITCYEYNSPNPEQIRLWKNGVPVSMPVSTLGAVPYCLFVNGTDIYVGGFEREGSPSNTNSVARYWKNGTPVTLGTVPNGQNIVKSIYLDGADVYAAGSLSSVTNTMTPMIWKNGVVYPLTGAGATPYGEILSVFVK